MSAPQEQQPQDASEVSLAPAPPPAANGGYDRPIQPVDVDGVTYG